MNDAATPRISVVIPTYERPERLARCLRGLAASRLPRTEFEVVVVDDGGTRPLDDIVEDIRGELDVRLIRQPNAGPASARNAGARAAHAPALAFTDDDCVPHPDWLTRLLAAHERHPDALIGGITINALSGNLLSEASQELVSYLYDYHQRTRGAPAFFTSNNLAMSRELFLAAPFDTSFRLAAGEDRELCDRWLAHGRSLVLAPDALVYHYHELRPASYWRQHYNYGRGAFHFHSARARRSGAVRLEPLSFYSGLLLFPFRRPLPLPKRVGIGFWLGVSQVANAAGYFREKWQARQAARRTG